MSIKQSSAPPDGVGPVCPWADYPDRKPNGEPYLRGKRQRWMQKQTLARPEVRAHRSAVSRAALARPEVKARQSAGIKKAWADPEAKARMSAAIKKSHSRPEFKEKMSEVQREAQNRPEVRKKRVASLKVSQNRPEVKEKMSASQKKAWAKEGEKERRGAIQREVQNRPEVKTKRDASLKAAYARPEVKERHRQGCLKGNAKPGVRERRSAAAIAACKRPGVRERKSAAAKIAQNRPEVKAKQSAVQKIAQANRIRSLERTGETLYIAMAEEGRSIKVGITGKVKQRKGELSRRKYTGLSYSFLYYGRVENTGLAEAVVHVRLGLYTASGVEEKADARVMPIGEAVDLAETESGGYWKAEGQEATTRWTLSEVLAVVRQTIIELDGEEPSWIEA
ncbi:MAG: hypothetical protein ISN29_03035 [Gammaproteobacteria bacterium AqS3]|nr:hypothetical protein [Gammaproteobacteria bacterium AqS3]